MMGRAVVLPALIAAGPALGQEAQRAAVHFQATVPTQTHHNPKAVQD